MACHRLGHETMVTDEFAKKDGWYDLNFKTDALWPLSIGADKTDAGKNIGYPGDNLRFCRPKSMLKARIKVRPAVKKWLSRKQSAFFVDPKVC